MKAILSNIKESLFDAPESVKKSFNEIVRYFAENSDADYLAGKGLEMYGLCSSYITAKGGIVGPKDVWTSKSFDKGDSQAVNKWKKDFETRYDCKMKLVKKDPQGAWRVVG